MYRRKNVLFLLISWFHIMRRGMCYSGLSFITLSTADNPLYGRVASEPGFLAAYNRLKPRYTEVLLNSTWHSLYYPGGNILCTDAAIQMELMAGRIYDMLKNISGFPILLSTGCSLEMIVLGDFAREWDVPLFSSTSGDIRLGDKQRFPTVIAGSGASDYASLALAAEALLDMYRWRTLTFLYDLASQYPGINNYFTLSYLNIKAGLEAKLGRYTIYTLRFDSGGPEYNVDDLLEKIRRQSRIVLVFTHPKVLRNILVRAFQQEMADGSYVFLASVIPTVPTRGPITWKYMDNDDRAAFEAFRSLIVLQTREPAWSKIKGWVADIVATARMYYNVSLTEDQSINEFAISSYEILDALIQVLNRSGPPMNSSNQMSGRMLAERLWNSSLTLPSRDFTITVNGMRMTDVPFYRLDNASTDDLQIAWKYLSANGRLVSVSPLAKRWKGGRAPPDRPLCGFAGDLCSVSVVSSAATAGATVLLLLTILVSAGVLWERMRPKRLADSDKWWLIELDFF